MVRFLAVWAAMGGPWEVFKCVGFKLSLLNFHMWNHVVILTIVAEVGWLHVFSLWAEQTKRTERNPQFTLFNVDKETSAKVKKVYVKYKSYRHLTTPCP